MIAIRVWHKDRWIPGKVVPFCHCIFFPYGGRELSSRKYQLLSTGTTALYVRCMQSTDHELEGKQKPARLSCQVEIKTEKEWTMMSPPVVHADFAWERSESDGSFAMTTLVPVDSCMPVDATNCLALACQGTVPNTADIKVLSRASLRVGP